MPLPTHLPHIIYATALTSLALHLLATRKAGAAARQQAEARISLLEGLATRLRAGERLPEDEVTRVHRLLREEGEVEVKKVDVDWKAVVFGKKEGKELTS